jgi:hypothetical protein
MTNDTEELHLFEIMDADYVVASSVERWLVDSAAEMPGVLR